MSEVNFGEKYREVSRMIERVSCLPKHIRDTQFSVPARIPAEFRQGKMPPNMYFVADKLSIDSLSKLLEEFKEMIGKELPDEVRLHIDKEI